MVKSKGRSGMRQYMKDKPVKFGFKLWVLADSATGYTIDFNIYTGRREAASDHGLGHDVVFKLIDSLKGEGFCVYFDNFYTSPQLLNSLKERGFLACGTCRENRRGFPAAMLDSDTWKKQHARGNMRWLRVDGILYMQWLDNKVVTIASTAHSADGYTWTHRRVKQNGDWRQKLVRKPALIQEYNKYMSGVDRSDQLLSNYSVWIKSMRWWKTLFFHLIDIACVNSCILFKLMMKKFPDAPQLQRPLQWSQLEFREELVRELAGIKDNEEVPLYSRGYNVPVDDDFISEHLPE
jgi:hypothetical protein